MFTLFSVFSLKSDTGSGGAQRSLYSFNDLVIIVEA